MKTLKLLAATLLIGSLGFSSAFANVTGSEDKEVQISVNDALVPSTVKAGENVKAVISGLFPNGCYKYSKSVVTQSNNENVITVSTYANVSPGMCIMVLVPFTKEVQLGSFQAGEYRVRFVSADETYSEKRLVVE